MRKTPILLAAFSLLTMGSAAYADDDMKMPPPAKPAAAAPKPNPTQQHQQGMQHGGQAMHDQMMKDHAAGMAGMAGMKDPPAPSGMKMGCSDGTACKDKKMPGMAADKPADAPMPMKDHM